MNTESPLPAPPERSCGAKTRSGTPCRRRPCQNGRCSLHGGKSTGPPRGNQNARAHGIYSHQLTEEEQQLWSCLEVNGIDDEIRLAKIQLRRVLARLREVEAAGDGDAALELEGRREATGGKVGEVTERTWRRPDYLGLVDRFLGRIGKLQQVKATVLIHELERLLGELEAQARELTADQGQE